MRTSRLVATVLTVACLTITHRTAAQTVVIVNRASKVSDVKLDDLRRFFLGQGSIAASREQVMLVELSPVRTRFYRRLLGLNPDAVRRRWIAVVFRGDALTMPFELDDPAAVKKFVAEHPGAVAFIEAGDVDDTVRALRIDGKRPGDPQYPLK